MTSDAEAVRRAAIDHHHDQAPAFEAYYRDMASSRFANAFTYGRYKVDVLIDELLAELPREARVLDVGCGTGEYLARIEAAGLVPIGVEPADAMREAARRKLPHARIESGVATALPLEAASVDAVIQIEVLRYLHRDEIRRALSEAHRVLRPGGALLVTLVNRYALDGFWVRQKLRQRLRGRDFDRANPHCEFFTPAEAARELRDAGFGDLRIEGRLFAPFRIAYKATPAIARRLAERLETIDDRLHEMPWTRPFAGHLVAIGRKR